MLRLLLFIILVEWIIKMVAPREYRFRKLSRYFEFAELVIAVIFTIGSFLGFHILSTVLGIIFVYFLSQRKDIFPRNW